jgi:tetratricopeptide (TPR) repeat protein
MKPRTCDRALSDVKLDKTGSAMLRRSSRFAAVGGRCAGLAYCVLCLIASLVLSQIALAQTQAAPAESAVDVEARNTTMARALFDEGLKYVDSEQWEQAQDRFGRVLSLRYSAVAAYNWGLALARLGRGVVAASALRRLLTDVNLDAHVHEHASSLLREVESRFSWLNVRVQGECAGCEVVLNEQLWPWAAIGVFVPVDAGNYALRLRLGNNVLAEQRLTIAATERVEATLASGHPANAVATGANTSRPGNLMLVATPQPAVETRRSSLLTSGWFWGAMGVLVIGAAGAIVLGSQ